MALKTPDFLVMGDEKYIVKHVLLLIKTSTFTAYIGHVILTYGTIYTDVIEFLSIKAPT